MQSQSKKLLTRKEAAARLGISLRALDGIVSRGALPAYRIGPKMVRIREEELEAYVSSRLVAPAQKNKPTPVRPCRYVPGMKVV